MIKHHRPIPTPNIRPALLPRLGNIKHRILLQNPRDVRIPLAHMMLPGCKMTINKRKRRVVHHDPRDNRALVPVPPAHAAFHRRDGGIAHARAGGVADEDAGEEPDEVFGV